MRGKGRKRGLAICPQPHFPTAAENKTALLAGFVCYTQGSVWTDGSDTIMKGCPTGAQEYLEEWWTQEVRRALARVSQQPPPGLEEAKVP